MLEQKYRFCCAALQEVSGHISEGANAAGAAAPNPT